MSEVRKLSTEEWIAVAIAIVVGIALFAFGFFLMNFQQFVPEEGEVVQVLEEEDVVAAGEEVEAIEESGEVAVQ